MKGQGNPQLEDGFTRVADELLEALIRAPLSGRELRVVLAVIRLTYGYQRKEAVISLGRLSELTGMGKGELSRVVRSLVAKGIVYRKPGAKGHILGVVKRYREWFGGCTEATPMEVAQGQPRGCTEATPEVARRQPQGLHRSNRGSGNRLRAAGISSEPKDIYTDNIQTSDDYEPTRPRPSPPRDSQKTGKNTGALPFHVLVKPIPGIESTVARAREYRLGRRLSEKQIRKLCEEYGEERLFEAMEVLEYSRRDIKNVYGYLKRVLEEGLDIPDTYWQEKVRSWFQKSAQPYREIYRRSAKQVEDFWESLSRESRNIWILHASRVMGFPCKSFDELREFTEKFWEGEKRETVRMAIVFIAKIVAFQNRFRTSKEVIDAAALH